MRKLILTWVLPLLVLDQAVKFYIKLNFTVGKHADFIPGVLELLFIENEGMAFGWALPGDAGKLLLSGFRIFAAIGIGIYLKRLVKQGMHKGLLACIALIWAGAIGNIIDGAVYGQLFTRSGWSTLATFAQDGNGYASYMMGNVVDMFHFIVKWPEWMPLWGGKEVFPPIWNIADAAISVGVFWILIRNKTYFTTARSEDGI